MAEREDSTRLLQNGDSAASGNALPYCIELWDAATGETVERILARALSVTLAHAIFQAARTEHPDRRVTLRLGSELIADCRGNLQLN
jgi:uncharacterized membrane protein YhfC